MVECSDGTTNEESASQPDRDDVLRALRHNTELLTDSPGRLPVDETSVRKQIDRLLDYL